MSAVAAIEAQPERSESETPLRLVPPSVHRLLPAAPRGSRLIHHLERYGTLPRLYGRAEELRGMAEESGLTGRGGAGFPTATKLCTVAAAGDGVVVANGAEGEPASTKDKVLMTHNPHLVLDGVLVAMEAVGADRGFLAVARNDGRSRASLEAALRERRSDARTIGLVEVPDRFVAGEESALVHWLNGGPAKPTFSPPRPFERGVGGRPTLVQNVETLANLGLIARFGARWFRSVGLPDEPGSVLVTVRGAVHRPGVVEVALGTPLCAVFDLFGGPSEPPQALLVGGYFGTWIRAEGNLELPLSQAALRPLGASLGARTIAVLPRGACGLPETARIARYLAGESAGQCGPCVFGLPALADALETVARGDPGAEAALTRLQLLARQIAHRGACAHPDGALRLVASALDVFSEEIDRHLADRCSAVGEQPFLPTRNSSEEWR